MTDQTKPKRPTRDQVLSYLDACAAEAMRRANVGCAEGQTPGDLRWCLAMVEQEQVIGEVCTAKRLVRENGPEEENMDSPIETRYQDAAVCPYCGYRHHDMWEHPWTPDDHISMTCWNEHCEKDFECFANRNVTYTTMKRDDK